MMQPLEVELRSVNFYMNIQDRVVVWYVKYAYTAEKDKSRN